MVRMRAELTNSALLFTHPTLQMMRSQMSIMGTQVDDLQSMMSEKDVALARLQNEFGPSLVISSKRFANLR